jgi:hypothetical protein
MSDHIVTSASGKKITLKRPEVLAQLRLVDAIGDSASNRVYLAMCLPLMYVADIDGVPVHLPATKREVEALFQRLDEDGLESVNMGIAEHFIRNTKEEAAAAKKSQETQDSDKS